MRTLFLWIHVSSVGALVGGMTFVFFVLRPALSREADEAAVKAVSSFIRTRFRLIGILLSTFIVASGIVNVIFSPPKGWYIVLLIFKVLLATGILYLYFRNAFAKAPTVPVSKPSATEPESLRTASPAETAGEWKSAWLVAPARSQVNMELMLLVGALIVILLGVILVLAS
jgi:putative copper export protein